MAEQRPSPEKLLQRALQEESKEKRGKLKIYLGAAPGVGKTHEMLHDALGERSHGLDVVIGVAESHGRQEIESLLKNFEIIPRSVIDYHGNKLAEFDLDAALKRHPGLIIIDEMAHTNAPGLRHKKRWQDIKELLDRGIDVYTTLNVQHIESISDDVAQIIHAKVQETVPDTMIEMADTIELVDLPPEELLKRLHEGKVYVPKQAEIAAEQFFRKGNLIALRELALRAVARRVGAQVLLYRQGEGIKHVWPAMEKILVCVGPGAESLKLIRAAKQMATNLQAEWIAVYVDAPRLKSTEVERNQAIKHLQFAEQLGAETRVLTGFDLVKEIMNFAREQNVTQIMIWKHIHHRWRSLFFKSLADELVRNSGEIDVYIMTGERENRFESKPINEKPPQWHRYGLAMGIVFVATIINFLLYPFLSASNLVMVYLLGVTILALYGQIGPSILGSILSVLAYDFFFIQPFYSFSISNLESFFTLIVMLIVALIISQLTILGRRQAEMSRQVEHQTSVLYTLSKQLSNTRGIDKLLNTGISYIGDLFNCELLALIPHDDHLIIRARYRTHQVLDQKEQGIAEWVFELGQKAGFGTDSLSFSDALYLPLLGSQGVIGVLRVKPLENQGFLTQEKTQLLEACANQIALALEVDRLHEQATRSELKTETDKVRSALLKSVSHDLRAPLVSIIGSASTQIEMAKELNSQTVEKLGKEIYFEAEQLSRLINNLLQISYLEPESINLKKQLLSLKDTMTIVLKMFSKKLEDRQINLNIPDDLPPIPFDHTLIQEVLINLIDNAIKFTQPKSPIDIFVTLEKNKVKVGIADRGPGIVPDEVNKLFEKFYRGRMLTSERGLGLGLAICRIIVEAHGGKIWAENRKEGGAIFQFTLPVR